MPKKILVIDDSPTLRKVMRYMLLKRGYDVVVSPDGKNGLLELEKDTFDLIILDMNMPVMSGIEVIKKLKQKENFTTPVLILSASVESKDEGLALGASYYLTKPFKPKQITACIEDIFTKLNNIKE